jgi:hypothetical protein
VSGVTAYDKTTAKEIQEMWKLQGFDSKVQLNRDGSYLVSKGNKRAGSKQYIYDTHVAANEAAKELHQSGISSEIIPLENGKFQLIIVTGSGKLKRTEGNVRISGGNY